MKTTPFPNEKYSKTKWFLIDASGKTLGRLATQISKFIRGKEISMFTPGVNQSNYVVVLNVNQIQVTGKKKQQKLYYRTTQRPGGLKKETFEELRNRIPSRILEEAVWGMLPKGKLGRSFFRKLFVYSDNQIPFTRPMMNSDSSKENEILSLSNYNELNLATIGKNSSWIEIKN